MSKPNGAYDKELPQGGPLDWAKTLLIGALIHVIEHVVGVLISKLQGHITTGLDQIPQGGSDEKPAATPNGADG